MSPALLEGGGVYEAHPVLLAAMALILAVASGVALAVNEIDTNGPDTLRGTNGDDNLSRNGANDVLLRRRWQGQPSWRNRQRYRSQRQRTPLLL
jgi:hypothetical protein